MQTAASARLHDWLGLIRFSHTIFALPFAALAAVMALVTPIADERFPKLRIQDLVGILACMVFARSAAMAFNRLVDRHIDAANPRTAKRHIPAGILSVSSVAVFTAVCGLGFVASTLWFLPNRLPLFFSLPVLAFLLGYSLAKRFTSAAHLWLGAALSLSPICVWIAIRGGYNVDWPGDLLAPVVLAVAVAAWVAGFDMIYACQDASFDADTGLNSIPAKYGIARALRIAAGFHLVMLAVLLFLPWAASSSGLGWFFTAGLVVVAALVIRQHRLVSPNDLDRVNQAFFDTNAAISIILLLAGVIDCVFI